MKTVEVIWDDAHVSTGETTVKKAQKVKPIRTSTVGYLVADNDDGLVIATDTYPKDKKTARIINFIPHGMIVEYWEYSDG